LNALLASPETLVTMSLRENRFDLCEKITEFFKRTSVPSKELQAEVKVSAQLFDIRKQIALSEHQQSKNFDSEKVLIGESLELLPLTI
jgi:hypothetical protein